MERKKGIALAVVISSIILLIVISIFNANKVETKEPIKQCEVTLKYVDEQGEQIQESTKETIPIGKELEAKKITGYEALDKTSIKVTQSLDGKQITFQYQKVDPGDVKMGGSIETKFINEQGKEIFARKLLEQVPFNQIQKVSSIEIEGYELISEPEKTIMITQQEDKTTVEFKYKKKTEEEPKTEQNNNENNNLADSSNKKPTNKPNTKPNNNSNNMLGNNKPNVVKKGTFHIQYLDKKANSLAQEEVIIEEVGKQRIFTAKQIQGYQLISESQKVVTLEKESQDKILTFIYEKIKIGNFKVQYMDENGKEIEQTEILQEIAGVERAFQAKEIPDYELITDSVQTGTIQEDGQEVNITFTYRKQEFGKIIVRYIDENFRDLIQPMVEEKAILNKEYEYEYKDFEGYEPIQKEKQKVVLTKPEEIQEIIFHLERKKELGDILVKYVDDVGNNIKEPKTIKDLKIEEEHYIKADSIQGYTLKEDYIQVVKFEKKQTQKEIKFVYQQDEKSQKTYLVELEKYGIKKDGTQAESTTQGINQAIKEAKAKGYEKVKLPKGTYAIDSNVTNSDEIIDKKGKKYTQIKRGICLQSNMQLDLTDCILKQDASSNADTTIITIADCQNSKIIGGTLIGDKYNHYYGTRINENGKELELGDIDFVTGEPIQGTNTSRTKDFISVFQKEDGTTKELPNEFYLMPLWNTTKNTTDEGCYSIYCYDEKDNYLGIATGGEKFVKLVTLQPKTQKIKIVFQEEVRQDATFYLTEEKEDLAFTFGNCINISASSHIEIVGTTMQAATGDCIATKDLPIDVSVNNIHIIDCELSDSRRQGISYIAKGESYLIKDTTMKDIAGLDPQCGIHFEYYGYGRNIVIDGCTFYNNRKFDIINYNGRNVEIKNCKFTGLVGATYGYCMNIHDNYFEYVQGQDKIEKKSGIILATKDNTIANNHLVNAYMNITGENLQAYGNLIQGGMVTIQSRYKNTYYHVEKIKILKNENLEVFEGSEFNNCKDIFVDYSCSLTLPFTIRYCKFIDSKLNVTGQTRLEFCEFNKEK